MCTFLANLFIGREDFYKFLIVSFEEDMLFVFITLLGLSLRIESWYGA